MNSNGGVKLQKWHFLVLTVVYISLSACISNSQSEQNIHPVAYCDLVANPSQYNRQIVRVKASHIFGFEWSYLTDQSCSIRSSDTPRTWITIPEEAWCEGAKQTSTSLPSDYAQSGSVQRDVTVVGTFHKSSGISLSRYPFYIELGCVEEAGEWQVIR
jgi:hypothetical protein